MSPDTFNENEYDEQIEEPTDENPHLSMQWLPLPLTRDQKAEMAEKMSELRILAEKLAEQKKSSAKSYNNQIESVQEELLEISRVIETGSKETEVECECKWNFPKDGIVSYYNAEGEMIFEREMTQTEIENQMEPSMFDEQPEPKETEEHSEETTGEMTVDESFEEAEEQIESEARDQ